MISLGCTDYKKVISAGLLYCEHEQLRSKTVRTVLKGPWHNSTKKLYGDKALSRLLFQNIYGAFTGAYHL